QMRRPRVLAGRTDRPLLAPTRRSDRAATLKNQHTVAIAEKAIPRIRGFFISLENKFPTGEGADQHEQSRTGQMKIGKQRVHHPELKWWIDENIGRTLLCSHVAVATGRFQD